MNRIFKTTIIIIAILILTASASFAQYNDTVEAKEIIRDLQRNKKIEIKNSVIVGDLYFIDSVKPELTDYKDNKEVYVSTIEPSITFENCLFKDNVSTTGTFDNEYTIIKNTFKIINSVVEGHANFSYTTFKKDFILVDTAFKKEAYFEQSYFEDIVDLMGTTVKNKKPQIDNVKNLTGEDVMNLIKKSKPVEFNKIVVYGDIDFTKLNDNVVDSALNFQDMIFKGSIIAGGGKGFTFKKDVMFKRCVFEKNVDISNSHFLAKVSFESSKFNGDLIIDDALFEEEARFTGANFSVKDYNFKKATFIKGYEYDVALTGLQTTRTRRTEGDESNEPSIVDADDFIKDMIGNKVEGYENLTIEGNIDFLEIAEAISEKEGVIERKIYFRKVIFNGNVRFGSKSQGGVFENLVIFEKCTFEGNVNFANVLFKEATSFVGSIFNREVNFHSAVFDSDAIFDKTKFNGENPPNFEDAEFKDDVSFEQSTYNGEPYRPNQ